MLHHGPLPVQRSDGIGSTKPSIKTDGYIIYWKVTPDGATDDTRLQIHRETVNFSADSITLDIHLPSAIPHTLTEFRYKDFAREFTTVLIEGSGNVVLSAFLYKLPIDLIKCGFGNNTDENLLVGHLKLFFFAEEFAKLRRDGDYPRRWALSKITPPGARCFILIRRRRQTVERVNKGKNYSDSGIPSRNDQETWQPQQ